MTNEYLINHGESKAQVLTLEEGRSIRQLIFNNGFLAGDPSHPVVRSSMLEAENIAVLPLDNFLIKYMKRSVDILFSSVVILLVFPWLIPLVGTLIKLDSRGPVFFLQKRNGKDGRIFTCIKFRSMRLNPESDITPAQQHDPRITRIGSTLRNYCLDELPQFLNVFWGDMTMVGPRPHMIEENRICEKSIPNYAFRFKVKPGITGLGQVFNEIQGTTLQKMENRTRWDTLYILNWSMRLEIKILLRTLVFCMNADKHMKPTAPRP